MSKNRKAFTLLELIFVIVVLGIVVSIVAEIIAKMYSGYIEARTNDKLQSKTELAAQQIANRLSYRVAPTAVAKNSTTNNIVSLRNSDGSEDILEWIGRDFVSYRGDWNTTLGLHTPAWSGFIDLDDGNTTFKVIVTPATRPNALNTMIGAQSFGDVNLMGAGNDRPAIIFRGRMDDFDVSNYFVHANTSHYVYPVECLATGCDDSVPRLQFTNDYADGNFSTHAITLYEHYDFVWSAYALVPVDDELRLYHSYQPWMGESLDLNNTTFSVLVDELQTFRFTQVGEVIRVKVCAREFYGDQNLTVCKEKAIL